MTEPKITLTIAGNDASGGAGIAADLKTFAEYGTYGIATLAVIATMDPENEWSHSTHPIAPSIVKEQLVTATAGKKIAAFKTGMLPNVEVIEVIANHIKEHQLDHFVFDPVMVCKGDDQVLNPENAEALKNILAPMALVATPNLFEAGQLSGIGTIKTIEEAKEACRRIHDLGAENVVIKGGDSLDDTKAIDVFYDGENFTLLKGELFDASTNHGAGCTFAAAITGGLAQGLSPLEATKKAKTFVAEAIQGGFQFNQYVGPVFDSAYRLNRQDNI